MIIAASFDGEAQRAAPAVAPRAALGAFSGQVLLGFAADVWTCAFGTDETVSSFLLGFCGDGRARAE